MLVKYWKSFKWFLFVPLILFVFFININKVNALVYKGQIYTDYTITGDSQSGTMSANTRKTINFKPNNFIPNNTYDNLVFKFGTFKFEKVNENTGIYCLTWLPDNTQSPGQTSYVCGSYMGQEGISYSHDANLYVTARLEYPNLSSNTPCTLNSELDNMWVCPLIKNNNDNPIFILEINNYNYSLKYQVALNGVKYYYNYDSTEMTIQQNTTNTNLQYIYTQQQQQGQYMQNDSTTGATTQMTGDFSDLASSFNSELQGVNDLSQLVLLPISLFMDLSTDNCQPLHLVVPFVNTSVDIPCMKAIFNTYFNGFYTIFTTIMSAIICYWVAIKSASLIKDIVDCDNDRIEVVDL